MWINLYRRSHSLFTCSARDPRLEINSNYNYSHHSKLKKECRWKNVMPPIWPPASNSCQYNVTVRSWLQIAKSYQLQPPSGWCSRQVSGQDTQQELEKAICWGTKRMSTHPHKKVKVKFTLQQTMETQRGSTCITLLFLLTSALDGGGWLKPSSGRFVPGKETTHPLYRLENFRPHQDSILGPSSL
jgi:hypothetical protein